MREALVKSDLVECVLGLGEGLFYNSPMPATVVILRKGKSVERRGKILFINAVNEVAREQAQSFLRDIHQLKVVDVYRNFTNVERFAAVATLDEIAGKGYSLAIPLYVAGAGAADAGEHVGVVDAVADWRAAAVASGAAITEVLDLLRVEMSG